MTGERLDRNRWGSTLLIGGATLVAVLARLGFFGSADSRLDLLAHFRVHYALAFLALLIGSVAFRRWRAAPGQLQPLGV